jgi:subtilisin
LSVKRHIAVATAIGTAVVGLATLAGPASAAPPAQSQAGRHIVVLKDSADSDAVAAEHGKRFGAAVSHVYKAALRGYAATIPAARLGDVSKDSRVLFVGEDTPVSIAAQTVPSGITRMGANVGSQLAGNGSGAVTGVAVAVIDTGSGPHTDLNIVGGYNCANGNRTNYGDGNGHGTHVAGTIGAKDDNNGVVGMAPGVPVYSIRVLNNQGSGAFSTIACGIDWVTANGPRLGIKLASMSLGGPGADDGNCGNTNRDALHKAICRSVAAGITYIVAAGNDNTDLAGFVPAAYNEVLTVTAATDYNGAPGGGAASTCRAGTDETPADFSNFTTVGSSDAPHTIAGPGVCITSTWKGGGYDTISGTSMATPHVSGAAAVCIASGQCAGGPAAIRSKLLADAAAQPASYGFTGDAKNPLPPVGGKTLYYGHLAYAGSY